MPDSEIKDLVKYKENKSLTNCDLPEGETNQHDDGNKEGNWKVGVFLPTSALSAGVGRAAAISQTLCTSCAVFIQRRAARSCESRVSSLRVGV